MSRRTVVLQSFFRTTAVACAIAAVAASSSLAQPSLRLVVSRDDVKNLIGTYDVKLVFVEGGETYLVDYAQTSPSVQKLNGMGGANFPVISPDGNWVTYQTGSNLEGPCPSNCNSSIWIRPLTVNGTAVRITDNGYVPRFVESATAADPVVIYSTSIECPNAPAPAWYSQQTPQPVCTGVGKVAKRKIVGGTSVQAEEVVYASGSYYGGISYNNQYLSTAWPAGMGPFMLDLQNTADGPKPMHVLGVKNKTTQTDTIFAVGCCNPSRSPSKVFNDAMMYFDFGFGSAKYTHPLWGNWAQHEVFFITRMGTGPYGQQIRIYGLPTDQAIVPTASITGVGEASKIEWINPEWSNHPYFSTAALMVDRLFKNPGWVHTTNTEAIYAINLLNSTGNRLVESTNKTLASTVNILNPYLWVKVAADFQEDASWLATPVAEKPRVPVSRPRLVTDRREQPQTALRNSTITSNVGISGVTVFTGLGEAMWSAALPRAASSVALPSLKPGIYFVKAEVAGADAKIMRWVVR